MIYPASGTGAWEAALVNTLSPGDRVLMSETGHFATLWQKLAAKLGLRSRIPARRLAPRRRPAAIEERLRADRRRSRSRRSASCTTRPRPACVSRIADVRKRSTRQAIRRCCMVDTISSLASIDYRHDEWGVDVTVAGSQKGLMLPPGLSFNCISAKGARRDEDARRCRAVVLGLGRDASRTNKSGYFPYTPATNLLYGLREALDDAARRRRPRRTCSRATSATAKRRARAVRAWGLRSCAPTRRVFAGR